MYRGNSRNDAYEEDSFDNRRSNWNNERTNSYNDEPTASGGGSAFRRQFGSNVDTSKGIFQRGSRGGPLGKKQFPDADGGKRMFKGRFNGDGFVKKQFSKDDGGKKYFNGDTLRKGQSLSEQTSRTRVQRHSEDEVDDEAVSEEEDEEEDDDDEDFPQAGDVIRHSESVSNDADDVDDEGLIAEEMDEVERDEDVIAYQRRESRSFRKELPLKDSSLPKLKGEVLYGVGPVHAALQVSRREFFCLYVQQNMPLGGGSTSKKKDKKAFEWIIRSAIDRGLEVKELSKHDLNMLADNRPHQGLILDASPLEMVISTHLEEPHERDGIAPVWVALDEVTDPQNFGAILRSAYFLGAAGVVVCAKNSAPLSAVVSKASAGALEVMELRSCKNMMKFLDRSTENGWRVVGGAAAGTDVTSVRSLQRGLPTILVLGGEGKGLRTNVRRCCSELVCIPGLALDTSGKKESLQGSSRKVQNGADVDTDKLVTQLQNIGEDFIAVESLNVSVAAGILLHELLNAQGVPDVPILAGPVPSGEHNEGPGVDVELALSSVQVEPQTTETETVSINEHGHIAEANAYTLESVEQEQHVGIVASDIM
ncbi:hypothetical protein KP509_1Z044300 [Ceratopteris richardii]|nr:hypothetical protein KP509_1Z044300 [Ceratopteris richardii]